MKVVFVYKHIRHHSKHSGFDQLVNYVPSGSLGRTSGAVIGLMHRLMPKNIKSQVMAGGWYSVESLAKEIQVGLRMPFGRSLYSFLYGEDDFRFTGRFPFRAGNKIAVTYHQPPDIFDKVISNKRHVGTADGIIACGANQIEYFEGIAGRKVYYVPHGVDTDYFTPPSEPYRDDVFRVISVGSWLRDHEMIARIINMANHLGSGIVFDIVTLPRYFTHYKGIKNVNLYSGLGDSELKLKYQQADALLLPMKDCTANNSILEAMSCGLPVLTTGVGGIRGYVDEGFGYISSQGGHGMLLDALMELKGNPEKMRHMAINARTRAVNEFDWRIIAAKTMEVYERIWSS